MAVSAGKKAVFKLADSADTLTDISAYIGKVDFPHSSDKDETTTLGSNSRSYIATLLDGSFSFDGNYDPTLDAMLIGILGGNAKAFEYYPAGLPVGVTKPKYSGTAILTKYDVSTPVGSKASFSAELQLTGDVTRGTS